MATELELAREELRRQGKSIPQWAEDNGFPARAVRAVLYGHNKGLRGQSFRIAAALGLKE
ncbi:DNA-binding protein [Paracoccus subflavus]|uniref:DNA-binding protein n=1 Tax=Paracoccus subflavus TaxID=2528244 RepID=A0A4Q9G768_9RHOB|nr:DNA-binding protein [Paracoccus subflavus]TBN42686.1 DNA-binding protein [Paracoccus subflavus]